MYKTIAKAVLGVTAVLAVGQGTAAAAAGPLPQGVGPVQLPAFPVTLPTDLPVGGIIPAGK